MAKEEREGVPWARSRSTLLHGVSERSCIKGVWTHGCQLTPGEGQVLHLLRGEGHGGDLR